MVRAALADARNPASLSSRFRARRDILLREFLLERRAGVGGVFRVLDIGGTADYWQRVGFDWLEAHDIDITCVNHVASEFGGSRRNAASLRYIVGDGRAMTGHGDASFDFVHSNSVVEHVGRWPDMRAFANECRRLAPAYYVQTPYQWFPIDPHFHRVPLFHWYPKSLRLKLVQRMKVGYSPAQADVDRAMRIIESSNLLDRTQFASLFPDAAISFELIALLPKSLIARRGGSTKH